MVATIVESGVQNGKYLAGKYFHTYGGSTFHSRYSSHMIGGKQNTQKSKMKILFWLVLPIGVWASTPPQQRLRRGLTVESLEVEMQLETMTTEEQKQQIHKALGHHHDVDEESNVEVLEKVLETGEYPKPHHDETPETTEELLEQYLDAEPAGGGQSFMSKGSRIRNVNQPETLGVHGGGKNTADEKKAKFSEEEDEDDDDDEDWSPRKNDKTNADSVSTNRSSPPSLSPTAAETMSDGTCFFT